MLQLLQLEAVAAASFGFCLLSDHSGGFDFGLSWDRLLELCLFQVVELFVGLVPYRFCRFCRFCRWV